MFDEFIWPFHGFVLAHIMTGAEGLVVFWVPVIGPKGSGRHRRWGRWFTYSMLVTSALAVIAAGLVIRDPIGTHPHADPASIFSTDAIEGVFGWMMSYLGILTINLTWYGWECFKNRRRHAGNRGGLNLALQAMLIVAAANCAWRGLSLDVLPLRLLMVGVSTIGFVTVGTNLWFIYTEQPGPRVWIKEHLKGMIGAGISVYSAFFVFGTGRILPDFPLKPALWAAPLVVGVSLVLYHWRGLGLNQALKW